MLKERVELRVVDTDGQVVFEVYRGSLENEPFDTFSSPLGGKWKRPAASMQEKVAKVRDRFDHLAPMPQSRDAHVIAITQYILQITQGLEGVGDNPDFCNNVAREVVQTYGINNHLRRSTDDEIARLGRNVMYLLGFDNLPSAAQMTVGTRIQAIIK